MVAGLNTSAGVRVWECYRLARGHISFKPYSPCICLKPDLELRSSITARGCPRASSMAGKRWSIGCRVKITVNMHCPHRVLWCEADRWRSPFQSSTNFNEHQSSKKLCRFYQAILLMEVHLINSKNNKITRTRSHSVGNLEVSVSLIAWLWTVGGNQRSLQNKHTQSTHAAEVALLLLKKKTIKK